MANIPMKTIRLHGLDDTYTIPTAPEHIGALSTEGGRVTGPVTFDKELKVLTFSNNSGASCYARIVRFVIKNTYANEQISLLVSGRSGVYDIKIRFQNTSNTDPNLDLFVSTGTNHPFMHKVSPGTWDLYLPVIGYDNMTIYDLKMSDYMMARVDMNMDVVFVSSVPDGVTSPETLAVDFNIGNVYLTPTGYEYEYPSMLPGVEYRTTERWDGKPVYTKLFSLGALPNNNVLQVDTGVNSSAGKIIETNVFRKDNSGYASNTMGVTFYYTNGWNGNWFITVSTTENLTDFTAWVTIKYVKE